MNTEITNIFADLKHENSFGANIDHKGQENCYELCPLGHQEGNIPNSLDLNLGYSFTGSNVD